MLIKVKKKKAELYQNVFNVELKNNGIAFSDTQVIQKLPIL